jgi:hypothetical protein
MANPGDRDPTRPDEPAELELADVPRRMSRGRDATSPPSTGDAAPQGRGLPLGPRAGTMAPEPTAGAPGSLAASRPNASPSAPSPMGGTSLAAPNPWVGRGLVIAAAVGALLGGLWLYRRVTRADVIAISSPYRTTTGVTLDLPSGSGWKSDRRARIKKEAGAGWLRGDVMFRGGDTTSANEFVLAFRLHAPGRFASVPDGDQLLKTMEASLRQAAAASGADGKNVSCVIDREVRGDAALACFGRFEQLGRTLPVGVYVWIAGNDDAIGVAYAKLDGSLTPLQDMVRTAR